MSLFMCLEAPLPGGPVAPEIPAPTQPFSCTAHGGQLGWGVRNPLPRDAFGRGKVQRIQRSVQYWACVQRITGRIDDPPGRPTITSDPLIPRRLELCCPPQNDLA